MKNKFLNNLIGNKSLFERALKRASQPVKSTEETKTDSHSDDYNGKRTHSHKSEGTSGSHDDKSH